MLTPPVRSNARKDAAIGCACIFAAGVLAVGVAASIHLVTTPLEGVGYFGTAVFLFGGLLTGALILIRYWLRTERDCDKIDANTRSYDPYSATRYITVDDPNGHTGAIHYDGVQPDSVKVSVDGVRYEMDTRTGELR